MNKINLIGRLTRDPEIKYIQNEKHTAVARFTLTVDRRYKKEGEPDADFINCVAFGGMAEFIEKYFTRGLRIGLVGRVQTDTYTNRNGENAYSFQVIAEELDFADGKSNRETTHPSEEFSNAEIDMDRMPFD